MAARRKYYLSRFSREELVRNEKYRLEISENDVYGSWKVIQCESPANFDHCNLNSSELTFDEAGDIRWKLHQTPSDFLPFLTCDSYELAPCPDCKYKDCDQDSEALKLNLLSSETGELAPFILTLSSDKTIMTIRYQFSPMLVLKCEKLQEDRINPHLSLWSYSLLPALRDGLFSDLTITAENGQKFDAHKVVLLCACPTVDWSTSPPPLSNWPADAVEATLHFFYAGSLPPNVCEDTVEKIHSLLEQNKRMKKLYEVCTQFLESTALKRRITKLLNCIFGVIDEAYDVLINMKQKDFESPHGNGLCDPKNLLGVFKQIARQLSLALARFALFCEIFTKYKNEMTRDERHDIIKSLKSRLLAVKDKLRQCSDLFLESLASLTLEEQKDLARFLVPEVDNAVEVGTKLAMDGKDALDKIVQTSDQEFRKKPKKKVGMKLGKALRLSMFSKEVQFLKKLQEKAASGYVFFFQRREDFNSLPPDGKATLIFNCIQYLIAKGAQKLDQIAFELPENTSNTKNWKAYTKIVTSKLTWLISKMKSHKSIVEPILLEICELVKLEEFSTVLEDLVCVKCSPSKDEGDASDNPDDKISTQRVSTHKTNNPHPLTDTTASAASVSLSRSMGSVLKTGQYSDMTFLLRDGSDINQSLLAEDETADQNSCLRAHRVVLASRCDWFRRALTSGMKESIERTIHVYDTDRESFYEFLKFIYTGDLNTESKTLENLLELLALSDHYEVDNLKEICEQAMICHFTKSNIFEILVLADRFNAKKLKCDVLRFIQTNFTEEDIRHNGDFISLSVTLKNDLLGTYRAQPYKTWPKRCIDSSSEDSDGESYSSSPRFKFQGLQLSDSESSEDLEFLSNTNTLQNDLPVDKDSLEDCISGLREVLPSDISRGRLMEIALAADCDINRALNHYFS
ncbi:uncharacterized protein LOC114519665 isoform X2 [Dendronephthya gigantea]|uniref:uncharacterized protein LOC114519665 isoform X2 n=1 Tax=Dendronephthya gigantea TaxID=151771 RepID=UPI00106BFBC1|nr:uncharacterized protein LOC114519665 isoform X2 [Dendronephthya gigantea]